MAPAALQDFPRVIAAQDGREGFLLIAATEFSPRHQDSRGFHFEARVGVDKTPAILQATVDNLWSGQVKPSEYGMPDDVSKQEALIELAIAAVGWSLDQGDIEPVRPPVYAIDTVVQRVVDDLKERREARDEEIYRYIASSCYWAHVHRLPHWCINPCDMLRLGISSADFVHVARALQGDDFQAFVPGYWSATKKLIRRMNAGEPPEFEGKPVLLPNSFIDRLRLEQASEHLRKARAFLFDDPIDRENAVKEAVSALESVALQAVQRRSGTLGDAIKELRRTKRLGSELLRALDAVWEYSNQSEGVRHGKPGPSQAVVSGDARAVISMASALMLRLVEELERS